MIFGTPKSKHTLETLNPHSALSCCKAPFVSISKSRLTAYKWYLHDIGWDWVHERGVCGAAGHCQLSYCLSPLSAIAIHLLLTSDMSHSTDNTRLATPLPSLTTHPCRSLSLCNIRQSGTSLPTASVSERPNPGFWRLLSSNRLSVILKSAEWKDC